MRAGIIVDSLGISQLALQLITELNKINRLNYYMDVIVFYHKYDVLLKSPHFAMLQEQEMWGYDAPVIATTLATANRLLHSVKPTKKFFYVWDLEWTYKTYETAALADIYCNPNIELIARSESHYNILSQCWKKPAYILEDFNYEQFASIVGGNSQTI
jgi:hypothetical protein